MTIRLLGPLTALCACAAGCRTTEQVLADYERNVSVGNYAAQTGELIELAEEHDGSELLWRLLAASTMYMGASSDADAILEFDRAEKVLQRNDMKSVFAQGGDGALAMMVNDNMFAYDGGGLDRIFTCVYRGICFLGIGDEDKAVVEFNRAVQYQKNWIYERRKEIAASSKRMESDVAAYRRGQSVASSKSSGSAGAVMKDASFRHTVLSNTKFDPASSGLVDSMPESAYVNAYASHLAGIVRWLLGFDATYELRVAASTRPRVRLIAGDRAEFDRGRRPVDNVWVWVEDGLCQVREEWRLDLPFVLMPYARKYILYAGMALPRLRERCYGAVSWGIESGGSIVQMEELENIDRLVKTEYDVYMRGALTREITRTLVRVGAQVALGIAADNSGDDTHRMILRISQAGVAATAAASTAADLRSWVALPKRVMAARVKRPADGMVRIMADGVPISVSVPAGNSLVFIRKPGPSAAPVVRTVTLR